MNIIYKTREKFMKEGEKNPKKLTWVQSSRNIRKEGRRGEERRET